MSMKRSEEWLAEHLRKNPKKNQRGSGPDVIQCSPEFEAAMSSAIDNAARTGAGMLSVSVAQDANSFNVTPSNEHELQVSVVEWWDSWAPANGYDPMLLFAIPNGGARHPAVGAQLKAEGVRAGVPDMMLAMVQVHGPTIRPGLFIEHKMPGNGMNQPQVSAADRLAKQGYRVVVSYSLTQTQQAIFDYLRVEQKREREQRR